MSLNTHRKLEGIVLFITDKFGITGKSDTHISLDEQSNCIKYTINTRLIRYLSLTHMDATDDLCGTLEYFEENLPEQFQEEGISLGGSVGEKGFITITVAKYL